MTSAKAIAIFYRLCLVIALSFIPVQSLSAALPDTITPSQESVEGALRLPAPESESKEDPGMVELRQALLAFDKARSEGAEALIAVGETLHGQVRDILLPEIVAELEEMTQQSQDSPLKTSTLSGQSGVNAIFYVGINGAACAYTTVQAAVSAATSGDTV